MQKTVSSFKKAYPDIHLTIEQSNVEAILKDIERGALDLGFVRIPVRADTALSTQIVMRESYYVALPAAHPLTKRISLSPRNLAGEKMIIYPRSTAQRSYDDILTLFAQHEVVPEVVQEAVEQLTIAGLVAAGMGYSIVPECMTKTPVPGVVHLPLTGTKGRTGIAIVAKKSSVFINESFR